MCSSMRFKLILEWIICFKSQFLSLELRVPIKTDSLKVLVPFLILDKLLLPILIFLLVLFHILIPFIPSFLLFVSIALLNCLVLLI